MQEVVLGEVALMECERCRAMWVDAATFEHICADREQQTAILHQWTSSPRKQTAEEVRYRKCVACGKMMNRLNFGRLSGTVVDVCKGHGTFLDAGELHLIVKFIQTGGLDRARERQIQDLKDEEARLRALKTHRPRDGAPVDIRFETNTWSGPDLQTLLDHLGKLK
jgi:Zn-finger nucleic acid-binding protein